MILKRLKLIKDKESALRKRIQNYKYKVRYDSKYLFRIRKEVIINYWNIGAQCPFLVKLL